MTEKITIPGTFTNNELQQIAHARYKHLTFGDVDSFADGVASAYLACQEESPEVIKEIFGDYPFVVEVSDETYTELLKLLK
ncbi:hypothetical protein HYV64_04955 [Candidatus Shapirobacteria bacterium]|nr:hypothetical protein [Candidatus Shapirobacteria bacterium]